MLLLPGLTPIITEKNEMRQVAAFPESGVWIMGQFGSCDKTCSGKKNL